MRLTILGGGGFRVPLVYGALLLDTSEPRIDQVVLHDVDRSRLEAMAHVLAQQAENHPDAPRVRTSTVLAEAVEGADFVFSAVRVGALEGRVRDEQVALDLGVLGQETTGAGGIAYGWRTVPVALEIARTVARVAPGAWVINFTNPAGMVTEAMQSVLGTRVVGICDSPVALARRAAQALGLDPARTHADYAGLNHLGWLRALVHDGVDVLPRLLGDPDALATIEEARLFGSAWVAALRALPNEYLYYYYFTRDAVAAIRAEPQTRGAYLQVSQRSFYAAVAREPARALEHWREVRRERDASYLAEVRGADDERAEADLAGGGYEGVALAYMAAVMRGATTTAILNVRNGSTLPGLPPDAVVEVPCLVDAAGARPLATAPLTGHQLGLVQQVKEVEQRTIAAARDQDGAALVTAFALHPLVDSVSVARKLARGYGIL
nr:6-phospho-beta-glucosidase [uncultured Friedmanniella sp.]